MKKNFLFLALLAITACAPKLSPYQKSVTEFQKTMNKEFRTPKESPLDPEDLKSFKAHDFFPINELYNVKANFTRTPDEKEFDMATTTSRMAKYVKYGELAFQLNGQDCKLNLYQSVGKTPSPGYEDYLFLPFRDATNGKTSYSSGRFLDFRIPKGNIVLVDFNKAYNPYCAYSKRYSCPIVPEANRLSVAVEAGVRMVGGGGH